MLMKRQNSGGVECTSRCFNQDELTIMIARINLTLMNVYTISIVCKINVHVCKITVQVCDIYVQLYKMTVNYCEINVQLC